MTGKCSVPRRGRRLLALIGAVAAVTALATACSSSKSNPSGGATSSSSVSGPKLPGSPIKVGTIAEIKGVGLNWPFMRSVVEAAALGINSRGGVNGHPIQVDFCDGQNDPNMELNCARKLVSNGVVAFVGGFITNSGAAVDQLLLSHNIAQIGRPPLVDEDYKSPNEFLLAANQFGIYAGDVYNAARNGVKKLWLMNLNVPGGDLSDKVIRSTAAAHGLSVLGKSLIPLTSTNDASYVQAAISSGADGLIPSMGPTQTAAVLLALNQAGAKLKLMNLDTEPADQLKPACGPGGGVCTGSLGSSPTLPPTYTQNAGVRQFQADLAAQAKTGDKSAEPLAAYNDFATQGWLGMQAFAQVAKGLTTITAQSVYDGFKTAKNIDMLGMMPPWTPNASIGIPGYPRLSQRYIYLTELHSDLLPYAVDGKAYDFTKLNPNSMTGG